MNERPAEQAENGRSADTNRWPQSPGSVRTGVPADVKIIWAIARAEIRKDRHRLTTSRRKIGLLILGVAAFLPVVIGVLRGAYGVGNQVSQNEMTGLLSLAKWYLPVVVGVNVLLGTLDSDSRLLHFGVRELLLTTVSKRTLAFGLLLAELSRWLFLVGLSALVVLAFALGTGSLTVAVIGTAAAVLLLVVAYLWGTILGLVARLLWRRILNIDVSNALLHVFRMIALFLVFGVSGVVIGITAEKLVDGAAIEAVTPGGPPPIPLGHYAEFLFLGTPLVDSVSWIALASGAAVVSAIPLGVMATSYVGPRLWYLDPPHQSADDADGDSADDAAQYITVGEEGRDWPWQRFPSGFVAAGIVRRTVRTPAQLLPVMYYVLTVGLVVAPTVVELALLPTLLGQAFVILGIWIAGGAFGLNPLGDDAPMLPEIVLSALRPRTFVRARIIVGTVLGVPFVLLGTALLSIREYSLVMAVATGTFWLALAPASAAIAVGVGTLLPRSESGGALDLDVPVPEKLAIVTHGGVTLLVALAGGGFISGSFGLPVSWVGLGIVVFSTAVLSDICYRFAVSAIATYGRPRRSDLVYALELVAGVCLLGFGLSVTVPVGAATLIGGSGLTRNIAMQAAGSVGWAVAGLVYLLASRRSRSYLDVAIPTRDEVPLLLFGLFASGGVAVAIAVGAPTHAPFLSETVSLSLPATRSVGILLIASGVAVINAAAIEFLFRNVVQKRVGAAVSERLAVLVAASLFTLVHVLPALGADLHAAAVTLVTVFCLSLLWGWTYYRTESVILPVLCHALFTTLLVVL